MTIAPATIRLLAGHLRKNVMNIDPKPNAKLKLSQMADDAASSVWVRLNKKECLLPSIGCLKLVRAATLYVTEVALFIEARAAGSRYTTWGAVDMLPPRRQRW